MQRPLDDNEDTLVVLRPGTPMVVPSPREHKTKYDAAREALLKVLEIRGKPIDRRRGMKPSIAFQRAAEVYIMDHHYRYCVKYARSRNARHVPLEDMIQACLLGAYTALERYQTDHEHAYRFLSYAKWYLLCETNRLLHKDECLVVIPEEVKRSRAALARACRDDVPDQDAADLLGVPVGDVRAARDAHLGHEHRRVDERSKICRGGLDELREVRDERLEVLRSAHGLHAALANLEPLLRTVLWDEFQVGDEPPADAQRPSTDQSRRSLRRMAMRRLQEELEDMK